MSCSAKAAPPWPWNDLTPATAPPPIGAAGSVAGAAAAAGGGGAPCARLTVDTEASTDCAAVAVMPALVRPPTNARRDIPLDRYFATSSLIVCPLFRYGGFRIRPEFGAEIV